MNNGVLAIWNDCVQEVEAQYEAWYMGQHFPERLGVPGFRVGRRYQAIAAQPRYFTYYETTEPEVLWSDEYRRRLNSPTPETADIMQHFRNMSRTACRRVSQLGDLVSGHVVSARMSSLPDDVSAIEEALCQAVGVRGAQAWQGVDVPVSGVTEESKFRPEPDTTVGAAMVFHVMREQDALETSDKLSQALSGSDAEIGAYALLCEMRSET